MCGIAGILNDSLTAEERKKLIINMTATLSHRGPDGWGLFLSPHCAFGHTRLSIIDVAGGHQPLQSQRHVIVYNGEVYNHLELREELCKKGIAFSTRCDTEVVLKAYEEYGTDCFSRFNGQFAILIWDRLEKKLVVARDRFGVRPLYVLAHDNAFYFASELKAFDVIPGYVRSFDKNGLLTHALLWNTLGDATVFEKVRSVPGGIFEVYSADGKQVTKRYYHLGQSQAATQHDYRAAKEEFTGLLTDAVKLRLRSDVEVGTYLSGGIDSSVITHLTRLHNNDKFKTFSVGFNDREFDESRYQNEMVAKLDSDHHLVNIDYNDIDATFLDASYHFERPVFRTAPVPLFLLSAAVRAKNIKVILTGEAADEVIYGYDTYKELVLLQLWRKNPGSPEIDGMIRRLNPHLSHFSDPAKLGFMRMYYEEFTDDFDNELVGLNIRIKNNAVMANLLNKDWGLRFDKNRLIEEVKKTLPDGYQHWSILQRNQFLEMQTLLSGYLLSSQGDRMSMAHGVEGRYPFLDHRLVERVFYFDDSFKLNNFSHKHILRDCYRDAIPGSIIDRPKKPYTSPDLKSFYQNGKWSENVNYFLSMDRIKEYGIFDSSFVQRFIRKFSQGLPVEIGYRDNMIISFMLSAQMIFYWMKNPKHITLPESLKTVEITDPDE
jgi:asparagine synthase (glutamine-hydrolysing)